MMTGRYRIPGRSAVALAAAFAVLACGDSTDFDFRRPSEPLDATLFDLVDGPLDRASALDVVSGSGRNVGRPRAVRVDQSGEWDVAFAVLEGQAVWLPRGFFDAFEASSGITRLDRGFEEIEEVPGDRQIYEEQDPVPVEVGATYAIRSRNDPALQLPCRLFAKLEVQELEMDPPRIRTRFLWNPNCDQRIVVPEPTP